MKIINNSNVTHIKKFKVIKGVYTAYRGLIQCTYLPLKKGNIFRERKEEGYYENGSYDTFWNLIISIEDLEDSKKHFVLDQAIHTYPHIEIYVGKDLIHTEYFTNQKDLDFHLSSNYPNVNIRYE